MFTGVENCARTPPILLPVEPFPCALSRSTTSTFLQPAAVRCQAMLDPTIPPPIITASAVSIFENYRSSVMRLVEIGRADNQLGCKYFAFSCFGTRFLFHHLRERNLKAW